MITDTEHQVFLSDRIAFFVTADTLQQRCICSTTVVERLGAKSATLQLNLLRFS